MTPSTYWAAVGTVPYAPTVKAAKPIKHNDSLPVNEQIKNILMNYFRYSELDIINLPSTDEVVYVRHMISYVLYQYTDLTYEKIGKWMHKDHSTVMRACRLIQGQLNTRWDSIYKTDMLLIIERLAESGIKLNPDFKANMKD